MNILPNHNGHVTEAEINIYHYSCELMRPSHIHKPKLSLDGNKWCALYGDNLQDGVAGFGDSPELAYADFDGNWTRKIS